MLVAKMLDFAQQGYLPSKMCIWCPATHRSLIDHLTLCYTTKKECRGFRSWNYGKICPACCQRAKTPFVTHQNYLDRLLRSHCNFSTKTLRATSSVHIVSFLYFWTWFKGNLLLNCQTRNVYNHTHYNIWNQNVTMSKFHKVNSYLSCSQFLRGPQKRFNVKSNP